MADTRTAPLRVLVTADAVGGVWTHVESLVEALTTRRDASPRTSAAPIDCTVAVLGPTAPPVPSALSRASVHYCPGRLEWMDEPWEDVGASCRWLQSLAREIRPDVVHVNGFAHAALDIGVPVLVGAHSCVCSWWRAVHRDDAPAAWDRYRRHVRLGLQAAALVVTPTTAMRHMLEAEHGRLANATVIHNGCRTHRCRPVAREPLILSIGRFWDEAKNLAVLDDAAPRVPWPIVVLGATAGPAGRAPDVRHVFAAGPQPAPVVRTWLRRARIYAHPARYEPFGLAVLEAAQAGCALVIADLPSLREVWGDAAVYVPADDRDAWADALGALVRDAPRRDVLAAAARRVARRYSARTMADGYARAYASIRRTPRGGPW